jgi:hypothetical protein
MRWIAALVLALASALPAYADDPLAPPRRNRPENASRGHRYRYSYWWVNFSPQTYYVVPQPVGYLSYPPFGVYPVYGGGYNGTFGAPYGGALPWPLR